MDRPLNLPEGYGARPLNLDDAHAVTGLVAATEQEVDGAVEIDVSDIRGDWDRPSFDLATMAVGVTLGGDLVAFAETFRGRAEVQVHPRHLGRGLGTELLRWTEEHARASGRGELDQIVSDAHTTAAALLQRAGYRERWTSWILRIDVGDDLPAPVLPDGLSIRDPRAGDDDRALFDLIEAAFGEWDEREPQTFEDCRASVLGHEAVSPAVTPVVPDGDRIVGAAVGMDYGEAADEGWIHHLAVDARYRNRGLGRALLIESFRRFRATGRDRVGLATDSRTGALGLYEHVGMRVDRSYTDWAKRIA